MTVTGEKVPSHSFADPSGRNKSLAAVTSQELHVSIMPTNDAVFIYLWLLNFFLVSVLTH